MYNQLNEYSFRVSNSFSICCFASFFQCWLILKGPNLLPKRTRENTFLEVVCLAGKQTAEVIRVVFFVGNGEKHIGRALDKRGYCE